MTSVLFESVWHLPHDGWCIATRAYARAMVEAGLEVQLHSWAPLPTELDPVVAQEISKCVKLKKQRDAFIFSTTLGGPKQMKHALGKLQALFFPPRMFYTMFERTEIQPELVLAMNMLEGIWVPCSSNAETLRRCGSVNTTYIPYPYFPDDPALKLPKPTQSKNFLWIGRWEPRKAPDQLLKAFLVAFKPGEANLKMKLGPVPWDKPYVIPESCLKMLLELPMVHRNGWTSENVEDNVTFVRGKLTLEQIFELHAWADVYASASRGEGIDLPAFTAKLAGRRIVTVDSGGPRDFLNEGDILVPARGTAPAVQYENLWGPNVSYADFNTYELVEALQKARGMTKAPEPITCANEAKFVGKKLVQWIEECSQKKN